MKFATLADHPFEFGRLIARAARPRILNPGGIVGSVSDVSRAAGTEGPG